MNPLPSRVIDFVRFPLIVFVVSVHVHLDFFVPKEDFPNFPLATFFYDLTAHGITRIAVPLFFFISGYLFFLNASAFNRDLYLSKLKRRFWTLFVPMAVWGTPFFLAKFLAWKFGIYNFIDGKFHDYSSVMDFAHDLLFRGILAEELIPFWFIRGLIIACILSPLWFFLLKKFKFIPLILFAIWYCFFSVPHGLPPGNGYGFGAVVVLFFCSGAYFSIHGIDFTKVFRKIRIPFFVVYPILLVGNAVLNLFGYAELYDKLKNFEAMIGLIAAVALVSSFLEKHPAVSFPKTLFNATFFVYAGHYFLIHIPQIIFRLSSCETSLGIIAAFLFSTAFAVTGCVLLSILLRKFAPWSIKPLTGGR